MMFRYAGGFKLKYSLKQLRLAGVDEKKFMLEPTFLLYLLLAVVIQHCIMSRSNGGLK